MNTAMTKDTSPFLWMDYDPVGMEFVETWLDSEAVKQTGLDDGFRPFYEYWAMEDGFLPGKNFWCKVVYDGEVPIAVIAFCLYEDKISIMELVVRPEKRGCGYAAKLLNELLKSNRILPFPVSKSEAVIFPGNIASQKAFEKAGYRYHSTHEDGQSVLYIFEA